MPSQADERHRLKLYMGANAQQIQCAHFASSLKGRHVLRQQWCVRLAQVVDKDAGQHHKRNQCPGKIAYLAAHDKHQALGCTWVGCGGAHTACCGRCGRPAHSRSPGGEVSLPQAVSATLLRPCKATLLVVCHPCA